MFTQSLSLKINTRDSLPVAFDVGKSALDFYLEIPQGDGLRVEATSGQIPNRTAAIETLLGKLTQLAHAQGYSGLTLLCESTGVYSEKLLRLARAAGHFTAYVSGESVHKLKVVENNDTGKTDSKDPRVILLLAKMDKVLRHRPLEGAYQALRELNRAYDEERDQVTAIKGQCHALLTRLFCDLDFCAAFPYQTTGEALFRLFRFNPYRIVELGEVKFRKVLARKARGIRKATLARLWATAETSCRQLLDKPHQEALEMRLEGLWQRLRQAESRLALLRAKMESLYAELVSAGEKIPRAAEGFLNAFRIARILGETGPLEDHASAETLLKFAGLNLRERRSGQYIGVVRLGKKGRAPLRRVLAEACFHLVKKDSLYGAYFHRKKDEGMAGAKALAAVERKLLRLFYTLGRKGAAFDLARVSQCESTYRKAA